MWYHWLPVDERSNLWFFWFVWWFGCILVLFVVPVWSSVVTVWSAVVSDWLEVASVVGVWSLVVS